MVEHMFGRKVVGARSIDFVVLWASFYLAGSVIGLVHESEFFALSLLYSTILLICIRLGKRILCALRASSANSTMIFGNALGLFTGVGLTLLAQQNFGQLASMLVAVILASIITFFVLGTLAPLLKLER